MNPRWYRREDMPRLPGIWVCQFDKATSRRGYDGLTADIYSEADLARGAPFHCDFVFGPIPSWTERFD
jgi:hypothetical protein